MIKVFLGGTANSNWRDSFINKLKINYFNPVVDDWNEEAYQNEIKERKECNFVLYVITPKMEGVYSIAEVVDDSHKQPNKTIFTFIREDEGDTFSQHQQKSLDKVGVMVEENGGLYLKNINEVLNYLNFKKLI